MKKALSLLMGCAIGTVALVMDATGAASTLLPGSIDFNNSSLWGKRVSFGLGDDGTSGSSAHWYLDESEVDTTITRYMGKASGYLKSADVHRTLGELNATETGGPAVENGYDIPSGGLFVDTKVTMDVSYDLTPMVTDDRDKLVCWFYESEDAKTTNFVVTAGFWDGSALVATNYVYEPLAKPGEEFQLVVKAVTKAFKDDPTMPEGLVGFEVYVNGTKVNDSPLPSLVGPSDARSAKLYSVGFCNVPSVDYINFTRVDPIENPEYAKDDVTMLREYADITIGGAPLDGALANFPMLVKVSESLIKNFFYDRCAYGGSDVRFTDENDALIPCEVESWNPEGESFIWVKVPYYRNGGKIRMHWGLTTGLSAPANDKTAVWTDYVGVWHFGRKSTGAVSLADSSSSGSTAVMSTETISLKSVEAGMAGGAAYLPLAYEGEGLESVLAANHLSLLDSSKRFTFTGWYRAVDRADTVSNGVVFAGYKGTGEPITNDTGWAIQTTGPISLRYYASGEVFSERSSCPNLCTRWFHVGINKLTSGAGMDFYFNGSRFDSNDSAELQASDNSFQLLRNGFMADELRVAKVPRSAEWILCEYGQAHDGPYLSFNSAQTKDGYNYWLEKPYVSPTSIDVDSVDELVVYPGRARYGTPYVRYYDLEGNLLPDRPTAVGQYRAVFIVAAGARQGLKETVSFVIFEKRAYRKLSGYDRVMLFNSDASEVASVGLQGFYDIDSKTNRVWKALNSEKWKGRGKFVQSGTEFIYREPETLRTLWTFRHVRIGNLFQADSGLEDGRNFLPWGGTARRFDDSELPADAQRYAGTLMLQNGFAEVDGLPADDPAAAYSPMYADGIGAVYFDAVNGFTEFPNRIKLQISEYEPTGSDEVYYGDWEDVPIDVMAICGGVCDETKSVYGVTEATLNMAEYAGTTNDFYRIRAQIDTIKPVRVRIVRTDTNCGEDGSADGEGLLILDNIVVSCPAMGVEISQYGAPAFTPADDPLDLVLRGQRAPFSIPFPAVADLPDLRAMVKVKYIANNTNAVDSGFIGSMTMKYRWRYLEQNVGAWQELVMTADEADPTRFVATEPMVGEGVGDLEYKVSASVNAPFYEYFDYTGLNVAWPDNWTERRGDVAIDAEADGVYSDEKPSAAFGTDYFIRLRDGRSPYEGVRLHIRRGDKTAEETPICMELASDNTWRGFYQTLTNIPEGVYYRIEMVNCQNDGGGDYQWNTNFYCGTSLDPDDYDKVPINDFVVVSDEWALVPCDATTGYLMFQLDDYSKSLTVIHADKQDFNHWTDALRSDSAFLSTSQALPTSGVSRVAASYTDRFQGMYETVATNGLWWTEYFDEPAQTTGRWQIEVPFTGSKATPNGWTAANGMWVSRLFRETGDNSRMAFQMRNEGLGTIAPANLDSRGIGNFTFRARVAQTYDIHAFDYYTGTTNDVFSQEAYTFVVPCAMTTDSEFSGLGSVSAVAHFRDSKGGYEVRATRNSTNTVELALYKWTAGVKQPELLGTSGVMPVYRTCGFNAPASGSGGYVYAALFISCSNTANSVYITAGCLASAAEVGATLGDNRNYYKIAFEDKSNTRFTSGTFGVGSSGCPAVFAKPQLSQVPVTWTTTGATAAGDFYWWSTAQRVKFIEKSSLEVRELIKSEEDYEAWNVYRNRLDCKDYEHDRPSYQYGFIAREPDQTMVVEVAPQSSPNQWTVVTNVAVTSFDFVEHILPIYVAEDSNIQLRTGDDSSAPDLVVTDLSLTQWRGENYDDTDNPNRYRYESLGYGAPSNFVYTTGWVHENDGGIEISAMRTTEDRPASIRSPLMDGRSGRGLGLGVFTFAYRNADRKARLLVQIATNGVNTSTLSDLTENFYDWITVGEPITFESAVEETLASGVITTYIGLHGVKGVVRVVVDPECVEEAHSEYGNPNNDPDYGRIIITMATLKDNPELDKGSWWGWNLRTTDESDRAYLKDALPADTRTGLSFALNNSVTEGVLYDEDYKQHMPFLQTPVFTKGVIGEVSFKARRYSAGDADATVAIYGMSEYDPAAPDDKFEYLTEIRINCDRYETFTYQAPVSKNYTCFRLAITGVDGVEEGKAGPEPASGLVKRVLLDEVAVFEAIKARLGFRNVGAFRSYLGNKVVVPDMPDRDEQPLCNEAWGVQTELYAAQLSEKIDLKTPGREPRVFLHWYRGTSPWGFKNWRNLSEAGSGELAHAEGTSNLVYRSGYLLAPSAVISPSTTPGEIVQYSLEVVYYMEDQDEPLTNTLNAAEWVKPSWYEPVDLNGEYGGEDKEFSAYNILDTVSPGWAWFNEVNLFGDYDGDDYIDKKYQYFEIAAPGEADLTGWYVRAVTEDTTAAKAVTGTLATFGMDDLAGTKDGLQGMSSGMVFRVIGSPLARSSKKLKYADGTLDGVWTIDQELIGKIAETDGSFTPEMSFGLQLVRPSGIVEHSIVVTGTNFWSGQGEYFDKYYGPTNLALRLSQYMNVNFFYAGEDTAGENRSLSVWQEHGETTNDWQNVLVCTPGRINKFVDGTPQILDPEHPTPLGTSIFVYANLSGDNIWQTCGDEIETTESQILVLQRGSPTGTNIIYKVAKWYDLGEVTTNGTPVALPGPFERTDRGEQYYRVNVGKGASNNVTVVASAKICDKLRDYGVDENNRYSPAIIDWLTRGEDLYGNLWPDTDEITRARFWEYGTPLSSATNYLTLTEMYWLDMCPLLKNQYFIAGYKGEIEPVPLKVTSAENSNVTESLTNVRVRVYMAISNGLGHVDAALPGVTNTLYAPYVIRGLDPGSTSHDWAQPESDWGWSNATFKVTGILLNGQTSKDNPDNWVGLRWFVFDDDSFYPRGHEKEFTTEIEIQDPFGSESPAYAAGWASWVEKHGWKPLAGYGWGLDEKISFFSVELLKTNNWYKATK